MSGLKPIFVKLKASEKFQRLLAGIPSTAGMKSGHIILMPGESVDEHNTETKEEAIIVLEGQIDVYLGGKFIFTVEEENLIYIPPQTNHDIRNNGTKRARYIYMVSPAR